MFKHALGRIGCGVLLAAATLGVVMVATPGTALAASSGSVTCTGVIDFTTITGSVTVPAGATCNLYVDTVEGNVSVGQGASFLSQYVVVQRNLSTEGADLVALYGDTVDGNSSFDATSSSLEICNSGTIVCEVETHNPGTPNPNPNGPANKFGNVSITNTSGKVVYAGNFVAGNLSCYGNTSITNGGATNTVLGQESGQCVGL